MKDFIEISSRDNSVIKLVNSLKTSAKDRKETGLFVLEGIRICKDAADNNIVFKKLFVSETAMQKYSSEVLPFAEISEKCYFLNDNIFKKISDTVSPQGVIAVCEVPPVRELPISLGKFVALENLQDPSNLGALARTAEALGISGIIIDKNCCDPFSPKSLRASMGTLLRIPIYFTNNVIDFCNKNSLKKYACVVKGDATDIKTVSFKAGDVCIIGNEGNGLTEETIANSDEKVTIKMSGKAESLNASVAGAIAMWEMIK